MRRINLRAQRGATLLISLIMLVVLTLFAVAGFNLSSVNLKIAGNFQNQKYMEAVAQQGIEVALSNSPWFGWGAVTHSCAGGTTALCIGGFNVTVSAPGCIYTGPAAGYSLKVGVIVPDDNDWQVNASVTDALTGARATVTQGVRMRMLAGNCP
jgi:Tfp pilus assembly protein PilX